MYIRKYWSRSILTVDPIFKIEITYLQMFSVGIFIFKTLVYGIHFQKQKHILNAKGYDSFNGNKVTLLWFILDECLLKYSNYSRWCMASVYQELLLSSSVLTSSKLQFRFFQGIFISILSNTGRYNVISEKINGNLEKECKQEMTATY